MIHMKIFFHNCQHKQHLLVFSIYKSIVYTDLRSQVFSDEIKEIIQHIHNECVGNAGVAEGEFSKENFISVSLCSMLACEWRGNLAVAKPRNHSCTTYLELTAFYFMRTGLFLFIHKLFLSILVCLKKFVENEGPPIFFCFYSLSKCTTYLSWKQ